MNAGGVLLIIAGIWVMTQVLGGKALDRLGLTGQPAEATDDGKVGVPDRGYNNVPHNGQGYPL